MRAFADGCNEAWSVSDAICDLHKSFGFTGSNGSLLDKVCVLGIQDRFHSSLMLNPSLNGLCL